MKSKVTPRFRKIHCNLWGDAKFMHLSRPTASAQWLWIYLLSGPNTGIIPGVLCTGKWAIAEALDWSIDDLENCFAEIESARMAEADWQLRVIHLPKAIYYNPPINPSVVVAWRNEFATLPESNLTQRIYDNIVCMLKEMDEGFPSSAVRP